jgi:GNAT superfamily N-acetyltransferase
MYRRVGAEYQWVDRLPWSEERWAEYAARVETHLVELDGRPAGYYEIELDGPDSAKIALFGLLEEFQGIGLGGHALTAALARARELRPRVWLTTCTLDGPNALPNYRARGMRTFHTATVPAPA